MITAGFIGLGLIGGSIARAFKKNCPGIHITAYNRSPEPLARAVSDGIVDTPVHEVGSGFGDCDIIFLCTPVEHNDSRSGYGRMFYWRTSNGRFREDRISGIFRYSA